MEKVAFPAAAPVHLHRVALGDGLDDLRKGGLPLLVRQVDVVRHEAEGVEAAAVPCHGVREPVDEAAPVVVVNEDWLAVAPPKHHVVKGSGELNRSEKQRGKPGT